MKLQIELSYSGLPIKINYRDGIFFLGSCFTERIYKILHEAEFNVLHNPSGIIFDAKSLVYSLTSYLNKNFISNNDLFFYNDLFLSWNHHSKFSHVNEIVVVENINSNITNAHKFLTDAKYAFITLGSAFSYFLKNEKKFVSNCHRYPQNNFEKQLIKSQEIVTEFTNVLEQLFNFNSEINVIINISPVRHIRDGVINNNRSKANLIEAAHTLVDLFPQKVFYLPTYELVVDVLRDYRFYDIDLVHPNYIATEIIFEKLIFDLLDNQTKNYFDEIKQIKIALNHKPMHEQTTQHKKFLEEIALKIEKFKIKFDVR